MDLEEIVFKKVRGFNFFAEKKILPGSVEVPPQLPVMCNNKTKGLKGSGAKNNFEMFIKVKLH